MKRKSPSSDSSERDNAEKKARADSKDATSDTRSQEAQAPVKTDRKKVLHTEEKICPKRVQEFLDPELARKYLTEFEVGRDRIKLYGNPITMSLKSPIVANGMKQLVGKKPPFTIFPNMEMNHAPLLVVWLVINGIDIRLEETDEKYNESNPQSMIHNLTAGEVAEAFKLYIHFGGDSSDFFVYNCTDVMQYYLLDDVNGADDDEGREIVDCANRMSIEYLNESFGRELAERIHKKPKLAVLANFIPVKIPRSLSFSSGDEWVSDHNCFYVSREDVSESGARNVLKRLSKLYAIHDNKIIISRRDNKTITYYYCCLRKEEHALQLEIVYTSTSDFHKDELRFSLCDFTINGQKCQNQLEYGSLTGHVFCDDHKNVMNPSWAMELD